MCRVLIIEDEPLVAMMIEDFLTEAGATSFSFAVTEAEAVRLALAEPPDLITSDINLIEGTGPLAVAAIRERLGPLPVLYITANPEQCDPCPQPSRTIAKPFDQAMVEDAAHALMPLLRC